MRKPLGILAGIMLLYGCAPCRPTTPAAGQALAPNFTIGTMGTLPLGVGKNESGLGLGSEDAALGHQCSFMRSAAF